MVGLGVKKGPRNEAVRKRVVSSGDGEMAVLVGGGTIVALDMIVVAGTPVEVVLIDVFGDVLVGFAACCDGLASAGAGLFPVLPNWSGTDCRSANFGNLSYCSGAASVHDVRKRTATRRTLKRVEVGSRHQAGTVRLSISGDRTLMVVSDLLRGMALVLSCVSPRINVRSSSSYGSS